MNSPDSSNRARVHRAMRDGRCIDCHGSGQRTGRPGKTVQCPTCSGSGKLVEWTVAQVAYAAAMTVAAAIDALQGLMLEVVTEHSLCIDGGPDVWRLSPPKR